MHRITTDEAAPNTLVEMNTALAPFDSGIMNGHSFGLYPAQNSFNSTSYGDITACDVTVFAQSIQPMGQNILWNERGGPNVYSSALSQDVSRPAELCLPPVTQSPDGRFGRPNGQHLNTPSTLVPLEQYAPSLVRPPVYVAPFIAYQQTTLNPVTQAQMGIPLAYSTMMYFSPYIRPGMQSPLSWTSSPEAGDLAAKSTTEMVPAGFPVPLVNPPTIANSCPTVPRVLPVLTDPVPSQNGQTLSEIHQHTWPGCSADEGGFTRSAQFKTTPHKNTSRTGRRRVLGFHNNILFKTELCNEFMMGQKCVRGAACQFAHGEQDLRDPRNHPLYKTTMCRDYCRTGYCNRGVNCLHAHPFETIAPGPTGTNSSFLALSSPKS